jgi:hypothetical protein
MKTMLNLMPLLLAATVLSTGCVAKYRTIHKAQAGEGAEPNNSDDATPAKPDAAPEHPSAGLEIIFDGKSVTKVEAGTPFIMQPTKDTLDPDNRADDCTNPGIVSALYKASNGDILSAEREIKPACDKGLEVTHTIANPGTYVITLQVKTDENESAEATATLIVFAKGSSSTVEGGLVVKADPLVVSIGETVDFSAVCADGQDVTITWDFGDAATGSGKKTTHAYATVGSKIAKAKCEKPGLDDMHGSVTVVVLPGNKDEGDTSTGDDDSGDSSTSVPPNGDGNGDDDDGGDDGDDKPSDDGDGGDEGDGDTGDGDDDDDKPSDGDDDPTPPGKPGTPGQNPGQNPSQAPLKN